MPTTKIYYDTISAEMGMEIKEFIEKIPYIGLEVDELGEDYLKLEYTPNRLDYGIPYGIFKTFKGIIGEEAGLIEYKVNPPLKTFIVKVDERVKKIRPYISCFVVKNLSLSDHDIEYIINFQEDLHKTLGRDRRKVSIGIHDLDNIKPPIYYVTENESFRFIPLGFDRELSIKEILEEHPKGIEYGGLIPRNYKLYPILKDSNETVLSMPPIINSVHTQVTEETRNLFIDVTGWDEKAINQVVALLSTSLADIGGEIYQVETEYPEKNIISPVLEYDKMTVSINMVNRVLGLDITKDIVIESLERMRYGIEDLNNELLTVIPPYRIDILHPIDIIEDVAIGMGFWNIEPTMEEMFYSEAKHLDLEDFTNKKLLSIFIGLGFIEAMNMMLINKEMQLDYINIPNKEVIEVLNPKTSRNSVRHMLLPGLLENVYRNLNEEYPIKLFEVGWVIESGLKERLKLCAVIGDYKVNYGDIKAVADAMLSDLGMSDISRYEKIEVPFLIKGRAAKLIIKDKEVGFLGEVNPEVLLNFGINIPLVTMEIYIEPLFKIYQELS